MTPPISQQELAQAADALLRRAKHATLGTIDSRSGHPYTSLVEIAATEPGVLLLISTLAEHTTNLRADSRASLFITEAWTHTSDLLAQPRHTLMGEAMELTDAAELSDARATFLSVHPHAAAYASFKDFGLWLIRPSRSRYIEGFGRMGWIDHSGR
jgi:putative heme iron utilization protein